MEWFAWFFGLISNLGKNAIEGTHKAFQTRLFQRQIEEIDDKKRERESMIYPVTMDDIRRYDPKVRKLDKLDEQLRREFHHPSSTVMLVGIIVIVVVVVMGACILAGWMGWDCPGGVCE